MATLNVSTFEFELVKKISNTTDDKELAILHRALNVLKTGAVFTVISFSNLPDAASDVGKLYFVKNDNILYFSYAGFTNYAQWISIIAISNNFLWTWGDNNSGKLGDGTTLSRSSPGTVAGAGTNWCQVSGGSHTAAIKTDGTLWTWGCNAQGRLGDGTTTSRRSPGTVAGAGTNWCQVSAGYRHTAAIKTDGTLWTWGCNSTGQLGEGTIISRSSPGTVAGGGTTWCQVSSGCFHISAIKTDGTLWTWGSNSQGILGNGTATNRCSPGTVAGGGTTWCQVSGGYSHTAAIKTDGTLWTWGNNGQGRLGNGTTTARCSPGTTVGCGTNWCQVFAGCTNTAAIKTDGTLWTWGSNTQGILGNGTTTSRCSPGTVAGGGTNWCQVAGGTIHTAAIKTDGTLWTWGCGNVGVLGDGTTLNRSSPGTIAGGGTNWCQVSFTFLHTVAISKETL